MRPIIVGLTCLLGIGLCTNLACGKELVGLDSLEFSNATTWFEQVNKKSYGAGWKVARGAIRTLNAAATVGATEMDLRRLPSDFSAFASTPVLSYRFQASMWSKAPYGGRKRQNNEAGVALAARDYCLAHGGEIVERSLIWCSLENEPLFAVTSVARPASGHEIYSWFYTVVSPKPGVSKKAFIAASRSAGFLTPREVRANNSIDKLRQEAKTRAMLAAEKQEQVRQRAEASSRRQIGAKLCRKDSGWISVGFVEGKSPDTEKVQIRIVNRYWENEPRMQAGGFREQIIWDSQDKWFLCE